MGVGRSGDIEVERRFWAGAPAAGYLSHAGRLLFRVANNGEEAQTVNLKIWGDLGCDGGCNITGSSDQDMQWEATDQWVGVDDQDNGGDPSLAFVFHSGQDGAAAPDIVSLSRDDTVFQWSNVTLEPGEVQILMIWAIQAPNRATSMEEAMSIMENIDNTPWDDNNTVSPYHWMNQRMYGQLMNY